MKRCGMCETVKPLIEFSKNKCKKDGYQQRCKSCTKIYITKYSFDNADKIKEYRKNYKLSKKDEISEKSKIYYIKNKERIKEKGFENYIKNKEKIQETHLKYYLQNKDRLNKRVLQRRKTDPLFKLRCNIRSLIYHSTKKQGYSKKSKTCEILGCDFETFKLHIEKQFTKGMSWENKSEWHFDHIIPVSLARDEQHLIELNHYTNFQPLWATDNMSKGNRIVEKQLFLL